jgi:uncharacterized membrane protein YhaH (DUF805 family)
MVRGAPSGKRHRRSAIPNGFFAPVWEKRLSWHRKIQKETAMEQANFVLVLTPFQLQILIGFVVLFAIGAGLVLRRIGFSTWWALLCLIPITALIGIWALAFVRWPSPRATTD